MSNELYNPLTYDNLMSGLAAHFERIRRRPLQSLLDNSGKVPVGPGIYALFYRGSMDIYEPISDGRKPIYVGKADPPGKRKGGRPDTEKPALNTRLKQHASSIGAAENLALADFLFRSLAVEPVWIALAERFLIDNYKPCWNIAIDGFGKHNSGKARRGGERSWWDTLHPGRAWAREERETRVPEEAERKVREFFLMRDAISGIRL